MKLQIFAVLTLFSLVISSCSEDSICDCIRASDELTSKYDELRTKKLTKKGQKEVKELIQTKKAKCKEFELMSGPEMMERKADCK
ncbi:hypothetical protein [Fluviicola taffensis]|uniref:Lipoprotein n=1 Tax=Fluviicola taffensis (strain DSM 16823 / NCIMB 13979 / RW262) TaxID=755732 RepID=F2IFZ1_FLUTR|nr:hypothetical protein [Fluviicola taffensis]AEA43612.1 hypothetical protein Fluta_1620 [Fluviicola taffensis DSM 16823]